MSITKIEKVLLTGKTHTTHSRGAGPADRVDLHLTSTAGKDIVFESTPGHPLAEQLFAGAWSACYLGALGRAAKARQVALPADLAVDIEVDLGMSGDAFLLQARFDIRAPGLARGLVEELARAAHEICPYSKATRGNIDVVLNVLTA